MHLRRLLTLSVLFVAVSPLYAQQDFAGKWQAQASKTQAEQPRWMTPLVTVTPRLEQEFRSDFLRQKMATGDDQINYGNGKGLELIPARRVELIVNVPPYLQHNSRTSEDGFGDMSFLAKYRILSSNEEQHNYILTAFLAGSIPTGSYKNGSTSAIVIPTIAGGKGLGKFDLQSTLGVSLPVDNVKELGHAVAFNNALQYHVTRQLWPQVEFNTTFFRGGSHDGMKQNFITPGVIFGRIPLSHQHKRWALALGTGFQIATTHYHQYDHNWIFTVRMPF
ncbi:MAG: transporter [Acidobacteriaceae bacterium]